MAANRGHKNRSHENTRRRWVQSDCIMEAEDERSLARGFVRETLSQQWLLRFEECRKHERYAYDPPWLEEALRKLRAGLVDKLTMMKVKSLEKALAMEFIGPIQRKPRVQTEATRKWIANRESLEQMQAARPLKPPGRRL